MEEKENQTQKTSKIVICNQSTVSITGVSKVLTQTDKIVSAILCGKTIEIDGENLSVSELNVESGILNVEGKIFAVKFLGDKKKENILKRIFG